MLLQVCAPCTLLAARVQLLSCLLLQLCAPSTSFLLAAGMRLKNCLKEANLAQLYDVCLVMASAKMGCGEQQARGQKNLFRDEGLLVPFSLSAAKRFRMDRLELEGLCTR